jgi:hypothetical protein
VSPDRVVQRRRAARAIAAVAAAVAIVPFVALAWVAVQLWRDPPMSLAGTCDDWSTEDRSRLAESIGAFAEVKPPIESAVCDSSTPVLLEMRSSDGPTVVGETEWPTVEGWEASYRYTSALRGAHTCYRPVDAGVEDVELVLFDDGRIVAEIFRRNEPCKRSSHEDVVCTRSSPDATTSCTGP